MSTNNDIKSLSRRDFLRYTSIAGGAFVLGTISVSYTHLTLPTTPYV